MKLEKVDAVAQELILQDLATLVLELPSEGTGTRSHRDLFSQFLGYLPAVVDKATGGSDSGATLARLNFQSDIPDVPFPNNVVASIVANSVAARLKQGLKFDDAPGAVTADGAVQADVFVERLLRAVADSLGFKSEAKAELKAEPKPSTASSSLGASLLLSGGVVRSIDSLRTDMEGEHEKQPKRSGFILRVPLAAAPESTLFTGASGGGSTRFWGGLEPAAESAPPAQALVDEALSAKASGTFCVQTIFKDMLNDERFAKELQATISNSASMWWADNNKGQGASSVGAVFADGLRSLVATHGGWTAAEDTQSPPAKEDVTPVDAYFALRAYTADAVYGVLNAVHGGWSHNNKRDGDGDLLATYTGHLDHVIGRLSVRAPDRRWCYRGMTFHSDDFTTVGEVLTFKGYTSVSRSERQAQSFAASGGTLFLMLSGGVPVTALSEYPHEIERLLGRNTRWVVARVVPRQLLQLFKLKCRVAMLVPYHEGESQKDSHLHDFWFFSSAERALLPVYGRATRMFVPVMLQDTPVAAEKDAFDALGNDARGLPNFIRRVAGLPQILPETATSEPSDKPHEHDTPKTAPAVGNSEGSDLLNVVLVRGDGGTGKSSLLLRLHEFVTSGGIVPDANLQSLKVEEQVLAVYVHAPSVVGLLTERGAIEAALCQQFSLDGPSELHALAKQCTLVILLDSLDEVPQFTGILKGHRIHGTTAPTGAAILETVSAVPPGQQSVGSVEDVLRTFQDTSLYPRVCVIATCREETINDVGETPIRNLLGGHVTSLWARAFSSQQIVACAERQAHSALMDAEATPVENPVLLRADGHWIRDAGETDATSAESSRRRNRVGKRRLDATIDCSSRRAVMANSSATRGSPNIKSGSLAEVENVAVETEQTLAKDVQDRAKTSTDNALGEFSRRVEQLPGLMRLLRRPLLAGQVGSCAASYNISPEEQDAFNAPNLTCASGSCDEVSEEAVSHAAIMRFPVLEVLERWWVDSNAVSMRRDITAVEVLSAAVSVMAKVVPIPDNVGAALPPHAIAAARAAAWHTAAIVWGPTATGELAAIKAAAVDAAVAAVAAMSPHAAHVAELVGLPLDYFQDDLSAQQVASDADHGDAVITARVVAEEHADVILRGCPLRFGTCTSEDDTGSFTHKLFYELAMARFALSAPLDAIRCLRGLHQMHVTDVPEMFALGRELFALLDEVTAAAVIDRFRTAVRDTTASSEERGSVLTLWGQIVGLLNKEDLRGISAIGADLSRVHVVQCDLAGADLRNCVLEGAEFVSTSLVGADLRGASAACVVAGHSQSVNAVLLTGDGELILSGSSDGTVRISRFEGGTLVRTITHGDTSPPVCDIALSPDESLVCSALADGTIEFHQFGDGSLVRSASGHTGEVPAVAFTPDGKHVVSGGVDGFVRVTCVGDGSFVRNLQSHEDQVAGVAVSPDGNIVVSCGHDGLVRISRFADGALLATVDDHEKEPVRAIAISPDGHHVVSVGKNQTIVVTELATGALVRKAKGHEDDQLAIAISPDGEHIVSGSLDSTIRVTRLRDGALVQSVQGNTDAVNGIAVSPDGQYVISGAKDRTIRVMRLHGHAHVRPIEHHQDWVLDADITPDSKYLVTSSCDNDIAITRIKDGRHMRMITAHGGPSWGVRVSANYIASGSSDETVKIWHLHDGLLYRTITGHVGSIRQLAFCPRENFIVSGGADSFVRITRLSDGENLQLIKTHTDWVYCVAVTPDSLHVVSGSKDKTVRVHSVADGTTLRTIEGHEDTVWSLALSKDGTAIVSGSGDKTVRVSNLSDGELLHTITGFDGTVRGLAVTPDDRYIISSCYDKVVRLHGLRDGALFRSFTPHLHWIFASLATPCGNFLVSVSRDKTSRIVRLRPPSNDENREVAAVKVPRVLGGAAPEVFHGCDARGSLIDEDGFFSRVIASALQGPTASAV